ncbi:TrlF family AAA-like ATPase [Croceitalea sp. MTPC5]|uniref:TrlF family AAA-like ATPase n=1 Tax=Croceitalea sp. MTPC5 TaxID=3056565 RepID=UPI00403F47E2
MTNQYRKGSEWRRWDLHFHTPSSYDYKDKGVTNDNLVDGLVNNNIEVIAVTDHHFIDVERIQYLQRLGKAKGLTVLPGIEFLSDARGNEPIHFIAIFSEISNLGYIWGQIKNNTEIKKIEGEGKKPWEIYCDLADTVNLVKELGGIVTIHAGSKGNGIENITHSLPHALAQKEDIAQMIDVFELGKETDLDGYMAKVNPYLFNKIDKWLPIIICSDNHNINDYSRKAELWIKADPTFEGLKQIIYEPQDRVRISNRKPDEKKLYEVIDKVRFQDSSFTTDYIEINNNLTAIIGGKSTGKSILIKSIARTADNEEFKKRNTSVGIEDKKPVKGFEVHWADDSISFLGRPDNPTKRIIYIPQSYLNRVVDEGEKTSDIDEIIQEVLLQKQEFKEWYESLNDRKKQISDDIESTIKSLFENIDVNIQKAKEKKELGDKDGISKQIGKLDTEIQALQEKSQVSPEDIKLFNNTTQLIKEKRGSIELFNKDKEKLDMLKSIDVDIQESHIQNINSEQLRATIQGLVKKKKGEYKTDWQRNIALEIAGLNATIDILQDEISELEDSIAELQAALAEQKALADLLEEKEKEEAILMTIAELDKEIRNSYALIKNNIELLAELNSQYYSLYLEAKSKVDLNDFDDELSFDIQTIFMKERFQGSFVNKYLDGRKTRGNEYDYLTGYDFENLEKHKQFLAKECWKIVNHKVPAREGMTNKELVTALFQNWFSHDYKVTYQGDDISDMSPGKKSFVLLRLLIDLDDSQCPILIDQPEDDLDNRSIYNQVVQFLRRRKKTRQIIIVTHNPNLVLGADAEEIIVANQDGDDTKNKSFKFEYVSGSIEHTKEENPEINEILYTRGIQEHICEVLEGGREAFDKRKKKYNF